MNKLVRGDAVKRLIKRTLENQGINLSKDSISLGLTPFEDVKRILMNLQPINNGHSLIRVGGNGDGGYLVPNDFHGIQACFSPGSNLLWNFERELADIWNIPSYICDTPDQRPENLSSMQVFKEFWVGPFTDKDKYISLQDWITQYYNLSVLDDLVLQMDIEGAEFQTLMSLPTYILEKFRIIVIEIHFLEALKNRLAFEKIFDPFFYKLFDIFDVIHIHPNNCCGTFSYRELEFPRIIELTLHRKDRRLSFEKLHTSKHELDVRSVPANLDFKIEYTDSTLKLIHE